MTSQEFVYRVVSKREDGKTINNYKITHSCYTKSKGISNVEQTEPVREIKKFHKKMLEYLADSDMNEIESTVKLK